MNILILVFNIEWLHRHSADFPLFLLEVVALLSLSPVSFSMQHFCQLLNNDPSNATDPPPSPLPPNVRFLFWGFIGPSKANIVFAQVSRFSVLIQI